MNVEDMIDGQAYKFRVNMRRLPPTPAMRGQDRVQYQGRIIRDGGTGVFVKGQHDNALETDKDSEGNDVTSLPWWMEIIRKTDEHETYLMDELRQANPAASIPSSVDLKVVLGQVANVIDQSDDEHWTQDGKPKVEFFNAALKPQGITITRSELDAYLPQLVRN